MNTTRSLLQEYTILRGQSRTALACRMTRDVHVNYKHEALVGQRRKADPIWWKEWTCFSQERTVELDPEGEAEGRIPYTEGTGLQTHASLLELKSNRESGLQQASLVEGSPVSCMIGKPVGWGVGGSDHYHS